MGFFEKLGKAIGEAAEQGEDVVKHVFSQAVHHPELIALGPAAGLTALVGMEAYKDIRRGLSPRGAPYDRPPVPPSSGGRGRLSGLLYAATQVGKTIAGTQPYAVTSFAGVASGTAVTKNGDIADMFGTANATVFTTAGTFPWSFQSYRMRWNFTTVGGVTVAGGTVAQSGDPSWIATLHAVFSNATEIARVALNNLGMRTNLLAIYNAATVGVENTAYVAEAQPGVLWPVYYEKNGSYAMIVRTDHALTTTAGISISVQLDGWVINDPTLLTADTSQIQATIDLLMQGRQESTLVSLLGKDAS